MSLATAIRTDKQDSWRVIASVFALLCVFSFTVGLTYPLLAMQFELRGYGSGLIGLSAAMTPLGMIVFGPMIPWIMRRANGFVFMLVCLAAAAGSIALMAVFNGFVELLVLRFLFGVSLGGLSTIGETALHKIVPERIRGRMLGLYTTAVLVACTLGPVAITWFGGQGPALILATATIIAASAVPLLLAAPAFRQLGGEEQGGRTSVLGFCKLAPALLVAFAAVAVFENAAMSLMPLFGLYYGMMDATASALLSAALIGAVVLQNPIGWLIDRLGIYVTMIVCALTVIAACAALPLVVYDTWTVLSVAFVLGGAAYGAFTVVMTELGQRFSGSMLVTGNVAVGIVWGLSGVAGVPLTGGAMEFIGPDGFVMVIAALFLAVFAIYAGKLAATLKARRRGQQETAVAVPRPICQPARPICEPAPQPLA